MVNIPVSREERRLADHYARLLVRGEYRDAAQATREMRRNIARLRARHPDVAWLQVRRNYHVVHCRLCERALELGRPRLHVAWALKEERIVDRHVLDLLNGGLPDARTAGLRCKRDLDRLYGEHPNDPRACAPRTLIAVTQRILCRARALGQRWRNSKWAPWELQVIERCSRGILKSRSPSIIRATAHCRRELTRRQEQRQKKLGLIAVPYARSDRAIQWQLRGRTLALGRPMKGADWKPDELRIAQKWIRVYKANRPFFHRVIYDELAEKLRQDLLRQGHQRSFLGCKQTLQKACHRQRVHSADPGALSGASALPPRGEHRQLR